MNYIRDTFSRMDLQQIRHFMLYGTDGFDQEEQKYSDRLKNGSDPIYKRLEGIYPDGDEMDKTASDISQALTAYESVYMELGMKAGARLIYQLLLIDDPISETNVTK